MCFWDVVICTLESTIDCLFVRRRAFRAITESAKSAKSANPKNRPAAPLAEPSSWGWGLSLDCLRGDGGLLHLLPLCGACANSMARRISTERGRTGQTGQAPLHETHHPTMESEHAPQRVSTNPSRQARRGLSKSKVSAEVLGKPKVSLGNRAEGLGTTKVPLGKRAEGLGTTKVPLGKRAEGLGTTKVSLGKRAEDQDPCRFHGLRLSQQRQRGD
jgi:hypothetical protein